MLKIYLWLWSINLRDLSRIGSIVEFIGAFRQVLNSCHVLNLEETFYVIFEAYFDLCSRVISFGYDVIFKSSDCGDNLNESDFIIHLHGDYVGPNLLVDGLFKLTLNASYEQFLSCFSFSHDVFLTSAKYSWIFLQFSMLWHQHLEHIFKEILHSLVKRGMFGL